MSLIKRILGLPEVDVYADLTPPEDYDDITERADSIDAKLGELVQLQRQQTNTLERIARNVEETGDPFGLGD